MKAANIIVLGAWIVLTGLFIGRIVQQLASGRLLEGIKPAANRQENPGLYWRKMTIEIVMAAAMVALLFMEFDTLVDFDALWH